MSSLFVEDCFDEGLYHALTIRSPVASGKLLGVEIPRLPSSCFAALAKDIPGQNRVKVLDADIPILADKFVSYIGEPVALLIGPNPDDLERLAHDCVVRVAEEKPLFQYEKFSSTQLASRRTAQLGDTEEAFAHASRIIEGEYRTGRQEHWYPETQAAFARFAYDKLEISVSSQWPFHVRSTAATALNVRPEDVVVVSLSNIANLDGKVWYPSLIAAQAALAALLSRHPVRLILTRVEDVLFTPKRPEVVIRHRAALSEDGGLLALESRVVADLGASSIFASEILDRLCLGSVGAYQWPAVKIEGFAVRTNTVPAGPFAGFGLSQAFFAIERHVSRIAETLGLDPAEWRKEHSIGRDDRLPSGLTIKENVPAIALIDSAISMSTYRRKWAAYELLGQRRGDESDEDSPRRGIGLAFSYQGNGFLSTGDIKRNHIVEATLSKDGSLEIRTSVVSGTNDAAIILKKTAADILGIEEDQVSLALNRTDMVPDSGPSCLSRNVSIITKLVERCCVAIRKQRFRDPLPISVKRAYRVPRDSSWKGARAEGGAFSLYSWAAAVVEVELSALAFKPMVRGVWLVVDGGRILSEQKARSALIIATQHALSWARGELSEEQDGRYRSDLAMVYDLPAPSDQPDIKIDFLWTDTTVPKGIGELPFSCVPAAYAQALAQATRRDFFTLPLKDNAIQAEKEDE